MSSEPEGQAQEDDQVPASSKSCCKSSCHDRLVTKWADSSTIHGVDHVFVGGKSKIRRIVWGLILFGAIAGCLYSIIDRVIYFHSRPTATTVIADTNEQGATFPSITICNLSPIRRSFAESHNITSFLQYILNTDTILLGDIFRDKTCPNLLSRLNSTDPLTLNMTLRDIFVNGRFENGNVNSPFIQTCYFGHTLNVSNCLEFLQPTLTPSGLCYTFKGLTNSLTSPKVQSVGERYGLRMIINISQSEYLQSVNGDAGVKIVVHNSDDIPQPQHTGISVFPGSHGSIALYPHSTRTSPQISNCNSPNTNLEFFPSRSYSMSACKLNEYFKKSIELCGCTDIATSIPTTGQYSRARNCTIADACCLYDAFIASDVMPCLPSCEELFYQPTVSYSQYPSNRGASLISLLSDIDSQILESNILAINVYFGSVQTIVSLTDYSYSPSALLADIGGSLALFVGASAISFIELFFLCFDETKRAVMFSEHKVERKFKRSKEEHEMKSLANKENEEKQTVV